MKHSLADDGRLLEVERLGVLERELTRQAVAAREQLAALVASLLPPHAPEQHIAQAVTASGYSKTLIDGLCGGRHSWHAPERTALEPDAARSDRRSPVGDL